MCMYQGSEICEVMKQVVKFLKLDWLKIKVALESNLSVAVMSSC